MVLYYPPSLDPWKKTQALWGLLLMREMIQDELINCGEELFFLQRALSYHETRQITVCVEWNMELKMGSR